MTENTLSTFDVADLRRHGTAIAKLKACSRLGISFLSGNSQSPPEPTVTTSPTLMVGNWLSFVEFFVGT